MDEIPRPPGHQHDRHEHRHVDERGCLGHRAEAGGQARQEQPDGALVRRRTQRSVDRQQGVERHGRVEPAVDRIDGDPRHRGHHRPGQHPHRLVEQPAADEEREQAAAEGEQAGPELRRPIAEAEDAERRGGEPEHERRLVGIDHARGVVHRDPVAGRENRLGDGGVVDGVAVEVALPAPQEEAGPGHDRDDEDLLVRPQPVPQCVELARSRVGFYSHATGSPHRGQDGHILDVPRRRVKRRARSAPGGGSRTGLGRNPRRRAVAHSRSSSVCIWS